MESKKMGKPARNGVITRLAEFAKSKGGFAEVARRIGKAPSTFYNLERRDARPSIETIELIADVYPDIDLNYIITGKKPLMFFMDGEVSALRGELEREKAIVDRILGKDEDITNYPFVDLEKANDFFMMNTLYRENPALYLALKIQKPN